MLFNRILEVPLVFCTDNALFSRALVLQRLQLRAVKRAVTAETSRELFKAVTPPDLPCGWQLSARV